ncbi:serine hydrolase domain-containing protein [Streptomyces sp. MMS24-I29]|uniref:serine hydrolase domain-containing protein n=1 Tax=Streptomyces sp. MMS24-I29 TaxID=3351480 RepID=UPI003C7CDA2A
MWWAFAAASLALVVAFLASPGSAGVTSRTTGDAALAGRVAELLPDGQSAGGSVGLSVALVERGKTTRAALGTTDGSTPVTPDTVFETGSVQKVLTATLLAELLEAKKITLKDTLAELWPDVRFADPAVGAITIRQLATHTSGLPSIPPQDPAFVPAMAIHLLGGNGYAALSDPMRTLATLTGVGPGESPSFAYSNLGYAVLAETLAEVDGRDYGTALRAHVLDPLGMRDTTIRDTAGTPRGAALPHSTAGVPTVPFTNLPWAAVGTGTWTTSADLVKFLTAGRSPSAPTALTRTHTPLADVPDYAKHDGRIGLAWQIWKAAGTSVSWHNGLTNGSRTFVAKTGDGRAVVVLANSTRTPVEKIGFSLLGIAAPEFDEPQSPHPAFIALTLLLAAGAPALVLVGVVRPRRSRFSRPLDRLKVISLLVTGAALSLLSLRIGEWGHVPTVVWPIGVGLLVLAAAASVRAWQRLPVARGSHTWLRVLSFAVPTLVFGALLCTVAVITAQLP